MSEQFIMQYVELNTNAQIAEQQRAIREQFEAHKRLHGIAANPRQEPLPVKSSS